MRFLEPGALLWLGLAAPIVALYFLKMRRRRVEVPSTWLWRRGVNDLRVNAPFQRLRKSLLLLLQLLLLACGAFALARPSGAAAPPKHKRRVVLVDRSASMQATDVAPSRLERAKALAHDVVRESAPGDEIMVVAFGAYAQVMTPLTADRGAVSEAVDRIAATDGATRIQEAYRLAASALEGAPEREIVVVSDGGVEAIEGAEDIPVRFIPVGGTVRNAAVTALDVKAPTTADGPWTVFAQIDLFHEREQELPVELHVNGRLKTVKAVKVPANASTGVLFEVERPAPETVMVKIDGADHLAVDDRAWHVVRGERAKLLLAGAGDFFLEKALAQIRDADAFRMPDLSKASLGEFAVVVVDGPPPPNLPEGRYLIFGGVPAWEGIAVGPAVEQPQVVDWNRRHPVARHLDLSDLAIKAAPKVTLPGFGSPVCEAADTPLVFAWEKGRTRAVVVTFALADSDWPLRLSFPLFVSNAIAWLREESRAPRRPGEPLRVALPEGETKAEIATPGGGKASVTAAAGSDLVFGGTERAGVYTITTAKDVRSVALNLFDPQESRAAVAKELRIGKARRAAASAPAAPATPYWRWFAAGLLLLLAMEWLVYHRRF